MPEDVVPEKLHRFIMQNVRSLEQLEILLLVACDKGAAWTVQSVYDVILSTKPSVERWLDEFTRLGFLGKEPGEVSVYRFVAPDEIARLTQELGQLYKAKPVRVIEAIFKADRNPAQSFADAFRLKPKD